MEPLPKHHKDNLPLRVGKDFKNFARNTLSKRTTPEEALLNFNQFCTTVIGKDPNLQDYDTDILKIVEQFAGNEEITVKENVWLLKAILHIIKVMKKKEDKCPSEEIIPLLNKWQTNFWSSALTKEERRGIYLDLQLAVSPLFSIKMSGAHLEFDIKENEDLDKQLSENIEKLVDHKCFSSLDEHEQWAINHTIKQLSKNNKEEAIIGEKISLALKRSAISLHDIVSAKHTKISHSEGTMVSCLKSIFDSNAPPSAGYSPETSRDINLLLQTFSRSYDNIQSMKTVADYITKVEEVIPSTLLNPNIRRNFIGYTFSAIENVLRERPQEFYDEFFLFFKMMLNDLRAQAEESITDHDALFIENFQRCYLAVPEIILNFSDDPEKLDQIVSAFVEEYKNTKLSIYQLNILFSTLSLVARSKNTEAENTDYFEIELTSK